LLTDCRRLHSKFARITKMRIISQVSSSVFTLCLLSYFVRSLRYCVEFEGKQYFSTDIVILERHSSVKWQPASTISVSQTPLLSYSYCVLLHTDQPSAFFSLIFYWWYFIWQVCSQRLCSPIITGTVISARTYVLPPALWLSRRFDEGIKHMWVKGNMVMPSHLCVYPECWRADVTWERTEEVGLGRVHRVALSFWTSVCLPGHVMGSDDNRVVCGVQWPRSTANLPGHLAQLTLFK